MQIDHVDWPNKRFYLHADTVTNGFDAWEALFEIKQLQHDNANAEQGFTLFLLHQGKVSKGGGKFTPRYVSFLSGWRAVPYDAVSHQLKILVEMVSDDELVDREMFDRSGLSVTVDIDPTHEQVEIIQITTGGSALTTEEHNKLMTGLQSDIWKDTTAPSLPNDKAAQLARIDKEVQKV